MACRASVSFASWFDQVGAEKCGALFQELGIDFCVELFGASEVWLAELFKKLRLGGRLSANEMRKTGTD